MTSSGVPARATQPLRVDGRAREGEFVGYDGADEGVFVRGSTGRAARWGLVGVNFLLS